MWAVALMRSGVDELGMVNCCWAKKENNGEKQK